MTEATRLSKLLFPCTGGNIGRVEGTTRPNPKVA